MGSTPFALHNPVQTYAWGSRDGLARWAGVDGRDETPKAELWIGAHPKSPSRLPPQGPTLDRWLAAHPSALGPEVARQFEGLPFLLKILAAEAPLSVQCHPDAQQAREGFEREERRGIPADAPHRNYKDPNPKPELLVALTPFRALEGFRPLDRIARDLSRLPDAGGLRGAFEQGAATGLAAWLRVPRGSVLPWIEACEAIAEPPFSTVPYLRRFFSDDPSVLAPLFLNELILKPGEALFLGPGRLHAYLNGVAIEVMGSSDNVLRGGLTQKHVDVDELIRIVRPDPAPPRRVQARDEGPWKVYPTEAREFAVELLPPSRVGEGPRHPDRVEMLFALRGGADLAWAGHRQVLDAPRALLVPAGAPPYRIESRASVVRTSVPLDDGT